MWPQLGGHLVVRPHPKPLGQDHKPAGTELDGVADARGAAVGTERTGGAVAPPPRLRFFGGSLLRFFTLPKRLSQSE